LQITRRIGGIVLVIALVVAIFSSASHASVHTKWVMNANGACAVERAEFAAVPRYAGTRASMLAALPKLTAIRVKLVAALKRVDAARADRELVTGLYHYFALDIAELRHVTRELRTGSSVPMANLLRKANGYETSEAVLLRALDTTCGQV
jgi:hypothetical protein